MINYSQPVATECLALFHFSWGIWRRATVQAYWPHVGLADTWKEVGGGRETARSGENTDQPENTNCSCWGLWRGRCRKDMKMRTVSGTSTPVSLPRIHFLLLWMRKWHWLCSFHSSNWNNFLKFKSTWGLKHDSKRASFSPSVTSCKFPSVIWSIC